MKPCRTVGLDVTWRCNWNCVHCYYRHGNDLHTNHDEPVEKLLAKVDHGRARGLTHVELVGWGEPATYKHLKELLLACKDRGMTTSMITNGTVARKVYEACYYEYGLDHLLISSHAMGATLDQIAERAGAGEKQQQLKQWLCSKELPFRTNFVPLQCNYKEIPTLVQNDVDLGSFHINSVGFLTHYEWRSAAASKGEGYNLAVNPAELRSYLEAAGEIALAAGRLFTIRYHPMCHLSSKWWPYVVNARYVFFDPWEWNYSLQATDLVQLKSDSFNMGNSVAHQEECYGCAALRHCGGWNKFTAELAGAIVAPIPLEQVPTEYLDTWEQDGGLHDLNPANHYDGIAPNTASELRVPHHLLT